MWWHAFKRPVGFEESARDATTESEPRRVGALRRGMGFKMDVDIGYLRRVMPYCHEEHTGDRKVAGSEQRE